MSGEAISVTLFSPPQQLLKNSLCTAPTNTWLNHIAFLVIWLPCSKYGLPKKTKPTTERRSVFGLAGSLVRCQLLPVANVIFSLQSPTDQYSHKYIQLCVNWRSDGRKERAKKRNKFYKSLSGLCYQRQCLYIINKL